MKDRYVKIYQKLDVKEVEKHLLIYGDLSANCGQCKAVDIKLTAQTCPECHTDFKYIAFRNFKSHLGKLQKLYAERPEVIFIEYDDYNKNLSAVKAEEFLK